MLTAEERAHDIAPGLATLLAMERALYFPAGDYICSPVEFPSGTTIAGDGVASRIIAKQGTGNSHLWTARGVQDVEFRDLALVGDPTTIPTKDWWTRGAALALLDVIGIRVSGVRITGAQVLGRGILTSTFADVRVDGCRHGPCIRLEAAWACRVVGCYATHAQDEETDSAIGISLDRCSNVQVVGNHAWDNKGNGIDLANCQYCTVALNHIWINGVGGLVLDAWDGTNSYNTLVDNQLINNADAQLWIGNGVREHQRPADMLIVRGNRMQGGRTCYEFGAIGGGGCFAGNIPTILLEGDAVSEG